MVYARSTLNVNREKLREIKRTRLTEEQLDQVMDAIDERATSRGDKPISETLENTGGDFVQAANIRQQEAIRSDLDGQEKYFRPGTYMAALTILARVLRNSDYTDYDVKSKALKLLLEDWCRIHVIITNEARWVFEKMEEREEKPLTKDQLETMIRIVSKMLFEAIGGSFVSDLSTPALGETLNELEREGVLVTGKRVLALFLLEDSDDPSWGEKWRALIQDGQSKPFDIDVLIDRLWSAVNRKALDEEQDRRVLGVVDAVESRFDLTSEQKSSMLEGIRDLTNLKRVKEGDWGSGLPH